MRLKAIRLKYWLAAALVAVLAAVLFWVFSPSAALTGVSLESAGYGLATLESARFDNPCAAHAKYPIDFFIIEGDHQRRYAEHLSGSYTAIFAPMPFSGTGAELVPLMWLQAVRVDDIRGPNPTIDTKSGPVALRQLSKQRVYRDKNIVVFDVTALERKEDIQAVTQRFADEYTDQATRFVADGPYRPVERPLTLPMRAMLDGTYRFNVIIDMHRYLQQHLTQSILPVDAVQ